MLNDVILYVSCGGCMDKGSLLVLKVTELVLVQVCFVGLRKVVLSAVADYHTTLH
jgi:hypothetical protein